MAAGRQQAVALLKAEQAALLLVAALVIALRLLATVTMVAVAAAAVVAVRALLLVGCCAMRAPGAGARLRSCQPRRVSLWRLQVRCRPANGSMRYAQRSMHA